MLYGPRGILNLARARQRKDGERGQILVLFTLVIVVLMVSAAIVIDVGLLRTDSARLQNALDAGALAAAQSLPANAGNVNTIRATGESYASANYPGVPTPQTSFRCIIGADSTTGLPRLIDMPAVCNVPTNSEWFCTAAVCWAPCDPVARSTDVCNTVVLRDSVVRDYTFGRVVGVNSGNTGTLQAAACTGPCGPTQPVDAVLIIDRTASMSGLEDTLITGANAVLQAYDPTIQHIALGMLGPSSEITACSTGAMGKILEPITAPVYGSVQSATNASGGATSLVLNRPGSTAAGNLLVAGFTFAGGTSVATITPPTGWSLIRRTNNGTNVGMVTYYKVAGSSEGSSYTWGLPANTRASGGILRYTGVDTSDPIDTSAGQTGNDTSTPFRVNSPAITTTSNETAVIGFFGIGNTTTYTAPSGYTERFDVRNTNALGPSTEAAVSTVSSAGLVASDYATAGAGGQFVAQRIALNPIPEDTYPAGYPTTTPPFADTFIRDNMAKWIPVGLTGTENADIIDRYRNVNGTVNTSSLISRTLGCVSSPNELYYGTDQASPFDFAKAFLKGNSAMSGHGRPGVTTGIIFETDGTPQTYSAGQNFTCQQAQTAASAAKAAGIEVFTIAYFAMNSPNQDCPDTSGFWDGKKVIQSLAAMATNSATVSTAACDANENTDGDHFFCTPDSAQIGNVFRSAALALASGSRLVQLYPQPVVTAVAGSGGSAGGATVSISGQYFTEAYSVTFGGTPATSFTVNSDTSITAVSPAGPPNTQVDIQVSTPGGSSAITSADRFTYGP